MFEIWKEVYVANSRSRVDYIQDFVCELGMKPHAMHKSSGNNISCHWQTYKNYKGTLQRLQKSDTRSNFSVSKISQIILKKSPKNTRPGDQLLISFLFENFDF